MPVDIWYLPAMRLLPLQSDHLLIMWIMPPCLISSSAWCLQVSCLLCYLMSPPFFISNIYLYIL